MAKKTVKPVEVTEPTPVVKQTCRQMVESHLKRLRNWRQAKADAINRSAQWYLDDIQAAIKRISGGEKRPVNTTGLFGGSGPAFDVMCCELGMLDQEIEEVEAILELAAD
jgi:hypothetical protein